MSITSFAKKILSSYLCLGLLFWSLYIPLAKAEIFPTEQAANGDVSDGRGRVKAFLARNEVQSELSKYGLSRDEVSARLNALSDREAEELSTQIDQMVAGGDTLATVVVAMLVVFLVLLATDILGFTKVFSFTRTAKK